MLEVSDPCRGASPPHTPPIKKDELDFTRVNALSVTWASIGTDSAGTCLASVYKCFQTCSRKIVPDTPPEHAKSTHTGAFLKRCFTCTLALAVL